jgi:hypothetical protein
MKSLKSLKLTILIVFIVFSETLFCQVSKLKQNERPVFFGSTIDAMYWRDIRFRMSKSPLSSFEDFKNIYSDIPTLVFLLMGRISADKNYSVIWAIEKDYLYLYDVSFNIDFTNMTDSFYHANYPKYRQAIEKLTERKFVKRNFFLSVESKDTVVMKADWFSDTLYVQQALHIIDTLPFPRMIFEKGKLIKVDLVTEMK